MRKNTLMKLRTYMEKPTMRTQKLNSNNQMNGPVKGHRQIYFLTVPLTSRTAYTHPQLLLQVFTSPPTVANNTRDVSNACLRLLTFLFLCLPLLPFLFSVWLCGRFYFLYLDHL